jgi:hypothetical protein
MLNKTETKIQESIFRERTSRWQEYETDLNSISPRTVSDTICYIAEQVTPELMIEEPEAYREALDIALRGIEHESIVVRGAGLAILDRVAKQSKEYIKESEGGTSYHVDMLLDSTQALQYIAQEDEDTHLRVIASDMVPNILEKI